VSGGAERDISLAKIDRFLQRDNRRLFPREWEDYRTVDLEHVDGIQDNCAVVRGDLLKLSRPRKNAFMEALTDHLGEVLK